MKGRIIINEQIMLREGMAYFLIKLSDEYNVLQAASLEAARDIINDAYIDLAIGEISVNGTNATALIGGLRTLQAGRIDPVLFSVFRTVIRITPAAGRN